MRRLAVSGVRRWRTSAAPTRSSPARPAPTRARERAAAGRDSRARAGGGARRRRQGAQRSSRVGAGRPVERRPEGRAASERGRAGPRRSRALRRRALVHDARRRTASRSRRRTVGHAAPRSCRSWRSPPKHATMPPWLGGVLAALGVFLTVGLLTIVGSAVRESVLPPGVEPDTRRRWRARIGVGITAVIAGSSCGAATLVGGRGAAATASSCSIARSSADGRVDRQNDRRRADVRRFAIRAGPARRIRWQPLQRAAARSRQADAPVPRSRAGARRASRTCTPCRDARRRSTSTRPCRRSRPAATASRRHRARERLRADAGQPRRRSAGASAGRRVRPGRFVVRRQAGGRSAGCRHSTSATARA